MQTTPQASVVAPSPWGERPQWRLRTMTLAAEEPLPTLDLSAADEWSFLITLDGVPFARVPLAGPGEPPRPQATLEATLGAHLARARARAALDRGIAERLGAPPPVRAGLSCSVVVCTHRRPDSLVVLLRSLAALDPAPLELIVVDNDPGDHDCRELAAAVGARYVLEERPGLNVARARGVREARGDLVAFTDDDCLVPPSWLRPLPERFADPTVGAVTGPVFPHALNTDGRRIREKVAPFIQSVRRVRFDWRTIRAIDAGAVGAGANMVFRRSAVSPEELFPPELDAGTPTRSGGDLYALSRLLASGSAVAYEPGAYVYHRHPPTIDDLRATVEAYGIGASSFLCRALVADREPGAVKVWSWLVRGYLSAVLDRLAGLGDPRIVEMRRRYLLATRWGPVIWPRALRHARRLDGRDEEPPPLVREGPASGAPPERPRAAAVTPQLSVIVAAPDGGERDRCLRGLAGQHADATWEVISPAGLTGASAVNAGVRSARGRLLLVLAGDCDPTPGLIAAHLARHQAAGNRVVIGHAPLRPEGRNLAAVAERGQAEDRERLIHEAAARTCADFTIANISFPREVLERVGGLDPQYGTAAAREWGARILAGGVEAAYAPEASAPRVPEALTTRRYLEHAVRARGDERALVRDHPALATAPLDDGRGAQPDRRRHRLPPLVPGSGRALGPVALALGALEALHFRRAWHGLAAAFADAPRPRARRQATRSIELASPAAIEPPAVAAPRLELSIHGKRALKVEPRGGHWHPDSLHEATKRLDPDTVRSIAGDGAANPMGALEAGEVEVVFGPSRRRGDDRHRAELDRVGATVRLLPRGGGRVAHWAAIDAAVRQSRARIVAVPLPGIVVTPSALADAVALDGERIAASVAAPRIRSGPSAPGELKVDRRRRRLVDFGRLPAALLVINTAHYTKLGGLDPSVAAIGIYGPLLDYVLRAIERGAVAGYREVAGLATGRRLMDLEHANRWSRVQARGGLLALRAGELGGARGLRLFIGAGPILRLRILRRSRQAPAAASHLDGRQPRLRLGHPPGPAILPVSLSSSTRLRSTGRSTRSFPGRSRSAATRATYGSSCAGGRRCWSWAR